MDFQGDEHHGDELDGDDQAPAKRKINQMDDHGEELHSDEQAPPAKRQINQMDFHGEELHSDEQAPPAKRQINQMDFHGEELNSDEHAPAQRQINQIDFTATSSKRGRDPDEEKEPQQSMESEEFHGDEQAADGVEQAEGGVDQAAVQNDGVDQAEEAQQESMEIDDENDEVVREIDVYYVPPADENTQLYCIQYPLRPAYRPYDLENCLNEVRVKPNSPEIEMDIEVNANGENEADGEDLVIDQTLTSSTTILPKDGYTYAVGILQGDKLFLNPIHEVVQLRPSFKDDEEENEDTAAASSSSKKKPWVPLEYHSSTSDTSRNYLQKMMAANHSPMPLPTMYSSPGEYLNAITPGRLSQHSMSQTAFEMRPVLRSLPLEERVKKWLCEGDKPAYRFPELWDYLAHGVAAADLIKILDKQAVLIQGLWVPSSSTLQLGPREALTRDYLLSKFSKNLTIANEELRFKNIQNAVCVRVSLRKLANERTCTNDWIFKTPPDIQFPKAYPSTASHHNLILGALEPFLVTYLNEDGVDTCVQAVTGKTACSFSSMPAEKRKHLLNALQILFTQHSVHSSGTILPGLWKMVVSAYSIGGAGDIDWSIIETSCIEAHDELKSAIAEFTTQIKNVYVAKESLIHPELNSQRNVVIKLLTSLPSYEKLKKATILEAIKTELGQELSHKDYQKIMEELCISSGYGWVLKRPPGT